jgi:hypothetical protein
MKAFTNRVNAQLPIGKPDAILLALVQAHSEKVCGVACPRGQTLTDGQCIPDALMALSGGAKVRASSADRPVGVVSGLLRTQDQRANRLAAAPRRSASSRDRASSGGGWAPSFFRQQDRLGLN